jgi:hypothetical protein
LLDTPTFDAYITLVVSKHANNIAGYVIIFTESNEGALLKVQDIREKLFKVNGFHKPAIVIENIFEADIPIGN